MSFELYKHCTYKWTLNDHVVEVTYLRVVPEDDELVVPEDVVPGVDVLQGHGDGGHHAVPGRPPPGEGRQTDQVERRLGRV